MHDVNTFTLWPVLCKVALHLLLSKLLNPLPRGLPTDGFVHVLAFAVIVRLQTRGGLLCESGCWSNRLSGTLMADA